MDKFNMTKRKREIKRILKTALTGDPRTSQTVGEARVDKSEMRDSYSESSSDSVNEQTAYELSDWTDTYGATDSKRYEGEFECGGQSYNYFYEYGYAVRSEEEIAIGPLKATLIDGEKAYYYNGRPTNAAYYKQFTDHINRCLPNDLQQVYRRFL